jgi:hypothetical protein
MNWFEIGIVTICVFGMWVIGNAIYAAWRDSRDD